MSYPAPVGCLTRRGQAAASLLCQIKKVVDAKWSVSKTARAKLCVSAGLNVTDVTVSSILLNPTTGAAIIPASPSAAAQAPASVSAPATPSNASAASAAPVSQSSGGTNIGGIIGGVAGGIIALGLLGNWEQATVPTHGMLCLCVYMQC